MRSARLVAQVLIAIGTALAVEAALADPFPKEKFVARKLVESPPADDQAIVPGWRIGPFHLGMRLEALSKSAGTPDKTYVNGPTTYYQWTSRGHISVAVQGGRAIGVSSGTGFVGGEPRERTAGGVTGGTAQIDLVIAMGEPDLKMFSKIPKGHYYCYFDRGTYFFVDLETSRVTEVGVQTKKRMKEWCE